MRIDTLKGIGPQKKMRYERLGLTRVEDLLTFYPRRYELPKPFKRLVDCINGEEVRLRVEVISVKSVKGAGYGKERLHVVASDETGAVELIFFNARFMGALFSEGASVCVEGLLKIEGIKRTMLHPELIRGEDADQDRVRPVYALTEGLTQADLRRSVTEALKSSPLQEDLPDVLLHRARLMGKRQALQEIHFPTAKPLYAAAKYRIVYQELMTLQIALLLLKGRLNHIEKDSRYALESEMRSCLKGLPFKLTDGQSQALVEIVSDMRSNRPMHRLLQGDVGSGKTVLAFLALLLASENGYQSALMVPTEVLAEQHYRSILATFPEALHGRILLLTGTTKEKAKLYQRLTESEPLIVIGTHALIEEKVAFSKLGLVVTDEQHRFGVEQRNLLQNKGAVVDVLVMSATPIPRTLSMIRYGDMEISILAERPAGRQRIETQLIKKSHFAKLLNRLLKELEAGHQLYFVCPLIEENEQLDLQSAEDLYRKLRQHYPIHEVALIHGRLKGHEKDDIMRRFTQGDIHILVSTTVIEVGINVPNATVMCVMNAERFGLAQLHQLRGRVGRGSSQSYCYLIAAANQIEHNQRLQVLEASDDGFEIAQKDLEQRGPGELLGKRQHGLPELKLAHFFKHQSILTKVQEDSQWCLQQQDPEIITWLKALQQKLLL